MIKKISMFFFALCFIFLFPMDVLAEQENKILFFWAKGCPHCRAEDAFLENLKRDYPEIVVEKYEVSESFENQDKLKQIGQELNFDPNAVPVVIIDKKFISGYAEGITDREIERIILENRKEIDSVQGICKTGSDCEESDQKKVNTLFGEVNLNALSLPAVSALIGFLDGFNPCAMWVLIFLISLLLTMKDKKRMWSLGAIFIVVSGLVYFLFMSAWLNLLLFIGIISIVRISIGILAIGTGVYSIRDFLINKSGSCKIAGSEKRSKIFSRIREIVGRKNFFLAVLGIIVLAFAVNLVELLCSAGLPAIYTQLLTLNDLPKWQYYFYMFIYILFFIIDDLFVFVLSMVTLKLTGVTSKYSRYSRIVSGALILIIGLLMIFKPSWLMF
jgi:glutaredoxin